MPQSGEKRMRLRYDGVCRLCGASLPAGVEAVYERATKTVRCLECAPAGAPNAPEPSDSTAESKAEPPTSAPDVAGASARREYERRKAKREKRIRAKHPKLGGLILAMSDDPQSTKAWNTGAIGEEQLGRRLDELASDSVRVLHDRRIPGTRANIDHIAITPTGIYVIDAKRYVNQRPALRIEGGILRPRVATLMVGGRDRTKLVDGVLSQVEIVRDIVGDAVPVTGVLCFIDADWPLLGGAFTIRGMEVLWPKKLYPLLVASGDLPDSVDEAGVRLSAALPQA
ncbi:hypothetical protein GCM10009668_14590 [Nocardioides dubius]|uniref:NERD domain-containing protein n=1 Tax=Nocardioides dubius TaxID=317019 RepID=A0ABN1TTI7_9ACTN